MTDTFTATVRACELTDRNLGDIVAFTQVGRGGRSTSGTGPLISIGRVIGDLIRFKVGTDRFYLMWNTRVTVTRERGKGPITLRPGAPKDAAEETVEPEPTTIRLYAGDLTPIHNGFQVEFGYRASIVYGVLTATSPALDDMVALTLDGEQVLLPADKPVTVVVPVGADMPAAPTHFTIDIDDLEFA